MVRRTRAGVLTIFVIVVIATIFMSLRTQSPVNAHSYIQGEHSASITGNGSNDVTCHVNISANQRVEQSQLTRQAILREACSTQNRSRSKTEAYEHILVDKKHRVLYCAIPKVGCTNWKTLLVQLIGINPNLTEVHDKGKIERAGLKKLNRFPKDKIDYMLNSYYKFIFVRDPFERMLSAYKDKFTQYNKFTKYFQKKYGKKIIMNYRTDPSKHSLKHGDDVTFAEFVKYVIDLYKNGREFNPHWRPYVELCDPCEIDYDFLGKMETTEEDSSYVLFQMLNEACPPSLKQNRHGHQTTNNVTANFYRTLPKEDIETLAKVYRDDLELFAYQNKLELA